MPRRFQIFAHRPRRQHNHSTARHSREDSLNKKPGDQPVDRRSGKDVRPEELRKLCDLIRMRHALDIEIWANRNVLSRDRKYIQEKMIKADAVLAKINHVIQSMDDRSRFRVSADFEKVQEIKRRFEEGGKRSWVQQPPWEENRRES
jgi:hypothetical protein